MLDANSRAAEPRGATVDAQSLRSNISQLERRMIADALQRHGWNRARAARELGLSYPTLLSKIRLLAIERHEATD
jgi:two-component system response regulator HupR/HoxA